MDDLDRELQEAIEAFTKADTEWQLLLPDVPLARYLDIGKGEPGSPLRRAYNDWVIAMNAHHEAWERHRARARMDSL